MALADKVYSDCNALVKALSVHSLRIDDVPQFVLRIPFWCGGDSFV